MKVILNTKVEALGNVGEIVNVSPGYARNYLIPNEFAVIADESNTRQMTHYKKMLAKKVSEEKATATALKSKVDGLVLEIVKKVGASGKLFGAVTNTEISKELSKQGLEIERRLISLAAPIKGLGTFDVKIKLFSDVEGLFQVKVVMDPKQAEELKAKEAELLKKAQMKKEAEENGEVQASEETVSEKKELTEEEKLKEEANRILRS